MRPAIYEPEQIIEAGLALHAEGRNITGFALRNQVGGGNPTRLRQIWDEYQASQSTVVTEPVVGLPVVVAEEVKAVSAALSERITQLATELNDEERHQEQKTVLQDALNAAQAQHKNTREDLLKRLEQISAEANARTEELKSERDKVNTIVGSG